MLLPKYNYNDQDSEDITGRACSAQNVQEECVRVMMGTLEGKKPLRRHISGMIILKCILEKLYKVVWTGFL